MIRAESRGFIRPTGGVEEDFLEKVERNCLRPGVRSSSERIFCKVFRRCLYLSTQSSGEVSGELTGHATALCVVLFQSFGYPFLDVVDAVEGAGMSGEKLECGDFLGLCHPFPKCDRFSRVIAGFCHHQQTDVVGFFLLSPRIGQGKKELGDLGGEVAAPVKEERNTECEGIRPELS